MKHARLALIAAFAMAAVWSCKKDKPTDTPGGPGPSGGPSFSAFFANNIANATQTFTVNAAIGGQVTGSKGTRLLFEPGAFVHPNGTPVTGAVTVKLVEALRIGDMIMLNKQTVGNDNGTLRLLRSGGAINVYAEQGGNEVQITPGGLIAQIPTNVGDPNMELFRGQEDSGGTMTWDRIDSGFVDVDPAYYDSTDYTYTFPYYFYYNLNPANFNWINCDYFISSMNLTQVTATPPNPASMDSIRAWIAFPAMNTVMNLARYPSNFSTIGAGVPIGTSAVIIGLKQEASGYSSAFHSITVSSNLNVPMTFAPTTLQEFEDAVDAL